MHSDQFSIPGGTYLLSHSVGCMPAATAQVIQSSYLDIWSQSADPWSLWLAEVGRFNQSIARLLNASPSQVCSQVNLSSALTKIIHGLPRSSTRNTLLVSELDFPSLGFVFEQARRVGFEVKYVSADEDHQDLETWNKALTPDVFLTLVTHVQSNTGVKLAVDHITAKAKERDIITVVDVAQSAGVIPIDVQSWSADFVIGGCVKWLCGGPGASYLWADEASLARCQPLDVGWFSHAEPFEFDIHHFDYASDANRFLGGTPSVLPFVVARHSIDLMLSIGIDVIAQHNHQLLDEFGSSLTHGQLVSPQARDLRSGTAIVNFEDNGAVLTALKKQGVHTDQRAQGLRFSPHIYNTSDDMQSLAALLHSIG